MESLHTILHVHVSFYCVGQCARACAVRVKHNKKRGCSEWAWSRRLTTAIIRFAHAPRSWSVKIMLEPYSGLASDGSTRRVLKSTIPLFMAVFVVRTLLLFACFCLPVSVLWPFDSFGIARVESVRLQRAASHKSRHWHPRACVHCSTTCPGASTGTAPPRQEGCDRAGTNRVRFETRSNTSCVVSRAVVRSYHACSADA